MSLPSSGHGDIATMRFEEYIVEFSFCFSIYIYAAFNYWSITIFPSLATATPFLSASRRPRLYGVSGPVRCEDYIFGIRFLDITGYGDIGSVRFEEHISFPSLLIRPHLRCCRLLEHYAYYSH